MDGAEQSRHLSVELVLESVKAPALPVPRISPCRERQARPVSLAIWFWTGRTATNVIDGDRSRWIIEQPCRSGTETRNGSPTVPPAAEKVHDLSRKRPFGYLGRCRRAGACTLRGVAGIKPRGRRHTSGSLSRPARRDIEMYNSYAERSPHTLWVRAARQRA